MPAPLSRILDARGATRVRISPDQRWLCYVTDITGTPQLWRIDITGGMPRRLTFDCDRVGAYRISPDGARIAYGADAGGNEKWQLWVIDADGAGARRLTERDDRIHHLRAWTADGRALLVHANTRDPRYFDLWAHPVDGGAPRMLHRHDGTASGATPLADGSVVVALNRRRGDEHELVLVTPDGASRRLTPDEPAARHEVVAAVPGGVIVLSDRDRDFVGLATVALDGAFAWIVTADHDVEEARAAGHLDAYAVNIEGLSELHLREGDHDELMSALPAGCLATDMIGDSLALEGETVAVAWARYGAPSTIFAGRRGEPMREVVPPVMAGLADDALPEARLVRWPTFDGREIPGFLLTPRGASSAPRPTVIEVHGGPEGQARPLWNPRTVALVANGFNVLQPNVRGSTGYGKAYQALDDVRLRMDSVRDLDAAAAWLADAGIAPAGKIGVMGQSYGGFMTLAAVAFFPERGWAAAVDVYGIANFLTFFEHTDAWRRPLRAVEYGDPEQDRDFLVSISPITKLDAIRAPIMFIHGANDPRVPIGETEQIVAALRAKGLEIDYLRYEDEGHSLAKAKNRADAYPKVLAFFQRHMAP
ncbi:MAG TPA: prolyl oligopeptidase family serine peptidase [Candidatus Limnocylindria bacterium]|nr:prolyl oligopeptidase family serine peptidase [Candidatus Limnocylindria bacterium]